MESSKEEKQNADACCNGSGRDEAASLFRRVYGEEPAVEALPASGGDRRYFRLSSEGNVSVIATVGNDVAENMSFINLSRVFRGKGLRVPRIEAVADDCRCYLQEDLGEGTLLPLLAGDKKMPLAEESLRHLVRMQTVEESAWRECVCCAPFSRRLVMWDLNYFKYEFLKPCGVAFDEDRLEDDFEKLAGVLVGCDERLRGFMYRDFQSRNIIIKDGESFFIDFQGGRKGPLLYDAVSFLWQSKAGFSEKERERLLDVYAESLSSARGVDKKTIIKDYPHFALLRTLQVLGAYGFRGLVEKRQHFIESIPGALRNLASLVSEGVLGAYPELERIGKALARSRYASVECGDSLVVKVFSFSYKKGYPEDLTGNGGGFMFDCRGMHNPGRYEEYKQLTGLDREVVDFLESRGEVTRFVDCAEQMVSPSVETYSRRGFKSLQIGFGCTGGRHRSVYCAEHLAERLAARYPHVKVLLTHREQGIVRELN